MDFSSTDRLKLRVDALSFRLREVSAEVSATKGKAFELQTRLEELTVASLMEGSASTAEAEELRESLEETRQRASRHEEEEIHLRKLLRGAKLEYLRELRKTRTRRWIVME